MMKRDFLFKSVALSISLSLLGCGGDEVNNPAPPPPPVAAVQSISDVMTTAEVGVQKHVPIYQYIQPKEGQLLSIASVRAVSGLSSADSCPTPDVNGLELVYKPDSQGVCGYEYTITDGDSVTTARVISTASLKSVTKLTDISKSTTVGTALTTAISNPASNNETLTVVSVLGSGSAYASDNNVIFEAAAPGLARVIYTLSQEAVNAPLKVGVINITVNEAGYSNTAPTTPDITAIAAPNQTITLSPSITDVDNGDDPQLISVVNSQGATVRSSVQGGVVDDAYFTNKNFTFMANAPGAYTVYYTAHDHRGGYNTGKATVSVAGQVGLMARDASFYRDQNSLSYDFTVDLRSYVTAANPSGVTYLPAEFTSDSADKTPANLVMSSNNKILTYKVPANQSGVVKIKYTVKDNSNQTSGTIFISFGEALPTITTLGTTPRVDIGVTVAGTSTCGNGCVQSKTTYEWVFNGRPLSSENDITVPEGYSGESLTLIATPYNATGQRGVSKSVTYNYPFLAATVSVNKEKAQIGESITMTVNATYLGLPDAGTPVKVTPVSAANRKNQPETPTAKVNGSASATVNTDAAGNATFTLTDPNGKGVKTTFEAMIHNYAYGSEQAAFTTLTSPDVSTANFWGHMPNSIIVGSQVFYRTPLANEHTGVAGVTTLENGENWGRMTQTEALTYCANNVPELSDMKGLYAAHPSGDLQSTLGWPINTWYNTNTSGDVINMKSGKVYSGQSKFNFFVSCSGDIPIDSTGVTVDILKEDGTYTNDKFPPSSAAMTYGALMFPGAGIRINLPNEVLLNTITVSAPAGYVNNIVGKSVELTDMVPNDYRNEIITVVGENASGDFLGLKLKVSSSKYKTSSSFDYIPHISPGIFELQVDRGNDYPDQDKKLYQHGMHVGGRLQAYMTEVGKTARFDDTDRTFASRFLYNNILGAQDGSEESALILLAVPVGLTVDWLMKEISKTLDPSASAVFVSEFGIHGTIRDFTWGSAPPPPGFEDDYSAQARVVGVMITGDYDTHDGGFQSRVYNDPTGRCDLSSVSFSSEPYRRIVDNTLDFGVVGAADRVNYTVAYARILEAIQSRGRPLDRSWVLGSIGAVSKQGYGWLNSRVGLHPRRTAIGELFNPAGFIPGAGSATPEQIYYFNPIKQLNDSRLWFFGYSTDEIVADPALLPPVAAEVCRILKPILGNVGTFPLNYTYNGMTIGEGDFSAGGNTTVDSVVAIK